jgi:hypothetical protein
VVDNSASAQPLNFILFQLTQEYILVLSLVDAQLVFRNGDDRATVSAPIRDMGRLLDRSSRTPPCGPRFPVRSWPRCRP